jgi:hypothetical protein
MREAPLNVGMMIDTDLASMGHPACRLQHQKWAPQDTLRDATNRTNGAHKTGASHRLDDSLLA